MEGVFVGADERRAKVFFIHPLPVIPPHQTFHASLFLSLFLSISLSPADLYAFIMLWQG